MNIENDLNIPPDGEPLSKKISRIATQFLLPVVLPASSAFIGWIVLRRASAKLEQVQKEHDHHRNLTQEVNSLRMELDELKKNQQQILYEEENKCDKVSEELDHVEDLLVKRQGIYCSWTESRFDRFKLEKELTKYLDDRSCDKELEIHKGVLDITTNDKHCSADGRNGHLMWVYMDLWKARAQLRMYKQVVKRNEDA